MPGLIDCHVHAYLSEVNVSLLERIPVSLLVGRAAPLMLSMLNRGFTTVRDTARCQTGAFARPWKRSTFPGRSWCLVVSHLPMTRSIRASSRFRRLRRRWKRPPRSSGMCSPIALSPEAIAHLPLIMKEGFLHKNQLH